MTTQRAGMPVAGRRQGCRARAAGCALAALLWAALPGAVRGDGPAPGSVPAPRYFPPVERDPLDAPLRVTGSFGEYRSGHFHAGLDFSTGERVGRPVYAALPGHVVRVRASGVGYGRSIYLQADDGRLLVYGHLDAFDEPLAAYMDSVQAASGEYEQDLWPPPQRFRCVAGQRLGWSGRSGTDDPHLHFEIRRGDVAYNPLLAGVTVGDTVAPVIKSVTLFPADLGSRVDRGLAPVTRPVSALPDTFILSGQGGLLVEAADARADGRFTMAPWRVRVSQGDDWHECRFDSASWAEGMSEVDYVYDRGLRARRAPRSMLVWPAGAFASRVQDSPSRGSPDPIPETGGLARLAREGPLRVEAEDVAGHRATADVVVEPYSLPSPAGASSDSIGLAALDPSWPAAARAAVLTWRPSWTLGSEPGAYKLGAFRWTFTPEVFFERDNVRALVLPRVPRGGELTGASDVLSMHPVLEPLRAPFPLAVRLTHGHDPRVALYRDSGDGWEWLGADYDSAARTLGAETRRLGRFALFRDTRAPRVAPLAPPRRAPAGDYPRWALEARVVDDGSGVAARASWFVVDGRRVPSEWDAVAGALRWRPLRAPAGGPHAYTIVVTDRAGNARRRHGSFVLD